MRPGNLAYRVESTNLCERGSVFFRAADTLHHPPSSIIFCLRANQPFVSRYGTTLEKRSLNTAARAKLLVGYPPQEIILHTLTTAMCCHIFPESVNGPGATRSTLCTEMIGRLIRYADLPILVF
jgi:hypothetical protein